MAGSTMLSKFIKSEFSILIYGLAMVKNYFTTSNIEFMFLKFSVPTIDKTPNIHISLEC